MRYKGIFPLFILPLLTATLAHAQTSVVTPPALPTPTHNVTDPSVPTPRLEGINIIFVGRYLNNDSLKKIEPPIFLPSNNDHLVSNRPIIPSSNAPIVFETIKPLSSPFPLEKYMVVLASGKNLKFTSGDYLILARAKQAGPGWTTPVRVEDPEKQIIPLNLLK